MEEISSSIVNTAVSLSRLEQQLDQLISSASYMAERAKSDKASLGMHADNQFILTAEEMGWNSLKETLEQAKTQLKSVAKTTSIGHCARAAGTLPDDPRVVKNQQTGTEVTIRNRDFI